MQSICTCACDDTHEGPTCAEKALPLGECAHEDAVLSWGKGSASHSTAHALFGPQAFPAAWNVPVTFETGDEEGCSTLNIGSVKGGAVAIARGSCGFSDKALNAQRAGAQYVVIHNTAGRDDLAGAMARGDPCEDITLGEFQSSPRAP